jgi:HTH-type transcriptional regulator, glycine betaine synthesis regulator
MPRRVRPPDDPILRIADVIGGLIEFWGFKRNMGRAWTLLYLSPDPLTAADLGQRLALSAGAVSTTVNSLLKWGVVRKTWVPGERRDYYEPETSIWKMVSRVFRERELVHIQAAIDSFEAALSQLAAQTPRLGSPEFDRSKFVRGRIEALLTLARIGERLLRAILSGESVDTRPLKDFTGS